MWPVEKWERAASHSLDRCQLRREIKRIERRENLRGTVLGLIVVACIIVALFSSGTVVW